MQDFNHIIGHEDIKEHMKNAIAMKKLSHAYIIHGEEGMGKKLIASSFAKTLQCEAGGTQACNKCKSCLQFDTNNHPDIIWVKHEKASIGVDDIRSQVNADIQIKPYNSRYKIYIIEDADKLTEQAQNALLKTMEEPPAYAILMLLTKSISMMLPTILSRSIVLNLKPVDKLKIAEFLMDNYQVPDYLAMMAAQFSGGNVGKAIKYASSDEFAKMKEDITHILKYIDDMDLYELISGLKSLSLSKNNIEDYIDLMILWYRDVLVFKSTQKPDLILYRDEISYINSQARKLSYDNLNNIINAMEKAKIRLRANVNFDIAIELMLLSLKENSNG